MHVNLLEPPRFRVVVEFDDCEESYRLQSECVARMFIEQMEFHIDRVPVIYLYDGDTLVEKFDYV